MAERLYALQRDVDMIAIQVQTISKSLSDLDFLVHTIKKLEVEVMCIGAQMRRVEERLLKLEERVSILGIRMDKFEKRLSNIELKLDEWAPKINKIDSLDEKLNKLMQHFNIS